ncbi:MAG: GatB/YqeY domain-containing protein [Deltaproteobacteria bacterium]|nr:GatB/YqeY domain-containing protein [Deltaproteobacteria bacterium]
MNLRAEIEEKLKEAIKNKEKEKISVYRLLITNIKNKEVEKKRLLTEEEFYSVVRTLIRQHHESIESFKKGGRTDLVEAEEKELKILEDLLPRPLSEEEIENAVLEGIKEVGAKDRKEAGKVIKFIMEKYPGRIDGKKLSEMVLKRLSG